MSTVDVKEQVYDELSKYFPIPRIVINYLDEKNIDYNSFDVGDFAKNHVIEDKYDVIEKNWIEIISAHQKHVGVKEHNHKVLKEHLKFLPLPNPNSSEGAFFEELMTEHTYYWFNDAEAVMSFLKDWKENYEADKTSYGGHELTDIVQGVDLVTALIEEGKLSLGEAVEQFLDENWLMERLTSGEQEVEDGIIVYYDTNSAYFIIKKN